jgi:hypothetical protein
MVRGEGRMMAKLELVVVIGVPRFASGQGRASELYVQAHGWHPHWAAVAVVSGVGDVLKIG